MKSKALIGIARFIGWSLFVSSSCVVITGLIVNSGKTIEYVVISSFLGFAAFAFFLIKYQKKPNLLYSDMAARRPARSRIFQNSKGFNPAPAPETKAKVIHVWYRDTSGFVSERDIEILKVFVKEEKINILAFCHLRSFIRIFDADKIIQMSENGRKVDIQKYLRQYYIIQPENDPFMGESA